MVLPCPDSPFRHPLAVRPLLAEDRPTLERWLAAPHVARWYPDAAFVDRAIGFIGADWIEPHILLRSGLPIGYLQSYRPHEFPGAIKPYADLPRGAAGLDLFIGEKDCLGQGFGSAFASAHARLLLREGAPLVFADPSPRNAIALRAYGKAGFARLDARRTPWGECVMLVRRPASAAQATRRSRDDQFFPPRDRVGARPLHRRPG